MKKIIAINLKEIKYLGDSIGDDIFIEIKLADQIFKVEQKMEHGSNTKINKEISHLETEENILELSVDIKIIEDDVLFDDIGTTKGLLKIDLSKSLPQNQIFEVKVNEKRGLFGKRIAIFHITLEVSKAIRYVEDVDKHGWLIAKLEGGEEEFAAPLYLKIQLDYKNEGREYFTILEGVLKNKKASVSLKEGNFSRFSKINSHRKAVNLIYSISKKTLKIGKKTYQTTDYPNAPWAKGIYDVQIPDYPHGDPNFHPEIQHFTTWFLVVFEKARYVHTGLVSLGCLTIIEKEKYEEIYQVLIKARKSDDLNVGTLKVID